MKNCARCNQPLNPNRVNHGKYCQRRACVRSAKSEPDFEITVDEQTPAAAPSSTAKVDQLQLLVKLTRRAPISFEELCDKLDTSPAKCKALLERAKAESLAVELVGNSVGINLRPPDRIHETGVAPVVGKRQRYAAISDTHLGSRYCLREYLKDFIHYAYEQGVREILHSGDTLDGCYKHGEFEMSHMGLEEQTRDLFEVLPALPGLTYHQIDGNHDFTFTEKTGVNVGQFIASYFKTRGRNDFFNYGARGAMLRVRGALIDMWHPSGGVSYAVSYKLQKKIESYAPGYKPSILQVGHWHRMADVDERGVFAFAAGTFQGGGSAISRSLTSGPPAIGAHIISWDSTKDGTLRDIVMERRRYFENEQPLDVGVVGR